MISFVNLLEDYYNNPQFKEPSRMYFGGKEIERPEDASYILAGLSGLGGTLTGGPAYSYYSKNKERAADTAAGLLRGEPDALLKYDNTGTKILTTALAGVPVMGSIVNIGNAMTRNQAINALNAEMQKRK